MKREKVYILNHLGLASKIVPEILGMDVKTEIKPLDLILQEDEEEKDTGNAKFEGGMTEA